MNWSEYVLPDGTLNGRNLWKRVPLYKGMNGKFVERIYLSPEASYIFKPLTNGESKDRETWIYKHVLNVFPPIYPRLFASSEVGAGEAGWSIFEDLGPLRHSYDLELAREVAEQMACWHAFPEGHWSGLTGPGPKPPIEVIVGDLMARRDEAEAALNKVGGSVSMDWLIRGVTEGLVRTYPRVMSHGDLHLGNYARAADGRMYIIDWEHAHLNTPFWDLYHLIDISHPLFPKRMSMPDREILLDYYLKQCDHFGRKWNREGFIRDYCRFSAVFSLWMLLLISGDLERGDSVWPRDRLLSQKNETEDNLNGCLTRLLFVNDEGDKPA
ncbi:phosphotransferase [Fontibacillus sp. BL9]|uniref:phosphotransferase n=1 Tax=Fontibacillus sp. BL9 TaxID=3389971 RepID=UPI0039793521